VSDPVWPEREQGVFETLLIVDGSPVELDAHLERAARSVRALFGADLPPGTRELALGRARSLALGRLRLTVMPGLPAGALVAEAAAETVEPDDVFPSWERAIALSPFVIAGGLGPHKWADRTRLTVPGTGQSDGCLALVMDIGDEVLEASRANVFAVENEALVTPPADGRILPGVARARAIAAALVLEIELREEALTLDRLIAAGTAFLTGSVRGVEPVRAVGEAELAPPGEAVGRIAAELKRLWIADGAIASALAR
jgi:para-aminobenzoate synthetase / 4-amino-4-deoxychorismate lyase